MTFLEEFSELQARIAAARAQRDEARATGAEQRYTEACGEVQSLQSELSALRRQRLRAFTRARRAAA